jgi:hypothetical protein
VPFDQDNARLIEVVPTHDVDYSATTRVGGYAQSLGLERGLAVVDAAGRGERRLERYQEVRQAEASAGAHRPDGKTAYIPGNK